MSDEDHVTRVHRALAAPRRAEILALLRTARAPLAIQDIADTTTLHPNTVRNHLDRLVQAGLVDQVTEERETPGRPRSLFSVASTETTPQTPQAAGASTDDSGFRDLTGILAASLTRAGNPAAQAVLAGQRWLQVLAVHDWPARPATIATATTDLIAVLNEMDLHPVLEAEGTAITFDLPVTQNRDADADLVLLSVHVGMVERALERLDTPLAIAAVDVPQGANSTTYRIRLREDAGSGHSGRVSLPVISRSSRRSEDKRAQRRPA